MSKIKLKAIVSEIIKEMVDTHPIHKNINDKLMQIAKRGFDAEEEETYKGDADKGNKILDKANPDNVAAILRGEKPMKEGEGEEKEYTVNYWYRFGKYGDDKDWDDIKVKATSEAEAIEKAKQQARKGAMSSSFEIRKGK
jgi:hypothetical protein